MREAVAFRIGAAGALIPWLFEKLKPPFPESPSGIFVILGKLIVVAALAPGGIGTLLGEAFPAYGRVDDPADDSH